MAREIEAFDVPFLLGLPSGVWEALQDQSKEAAPQLAGVTVSMPVALAVTMWEAVGVLAAVQITAIPALPSDLLAALMAAAGKGKETDAT